MLLSRRLMSRTEIFTRVLSEALYVRAHNYTPRVISMYCSHKFVIFVKKIIPKAEKELSKVTGGEYCKRSVRANIREAQV